MERTLRALERSSRQLGTSGWPHLDVRYGLSWSPHPDNGLCVHYLVGSRHTSFSDFNILPVVGPKHEKAIIDRIGALALAFLDDKLDDGIAAVPTTELKEEIVGVKKDGKPKRKLLGNIGDVIVQ